MNKTVRSNLLAEAGMYVESASSYNDLSHNAGKKAKQYRLQAVLHLQVASAMISKASH